MRFLFIGWLCIYSFSLLSMNKESQSDAEEKSQILFNLVKSHYLKNESWQSDFDDFLVQQFIQFLIGKKSFSLSELSTTTNFRKLTSAIEVLEENGYLHRPIKGRVNHCTKFTVSLDSLKKKENVGRKKISKNIKKIPINNSKNTRYMKKTKRVRSKYIKKDKIIFGLSTTLNGKIEELVKIDL